MEQNFDVEKWRIENPMDYVKAMSFINQSPDKNAMFKTIFKITRLHIPDVLYKYHSLTNDVHLNEEKLNTLINKQVYMSDVKFLNDPFDSKAYFYRTDELKKFARLAQHGGRLIDDFTTFIKVAALTSNGINSMPMWAHYSNNHTGFCVSYDMKSVNNNQLSSCTFPVQYTNIRVDVTDLMVEIAAKIFEKIEKQTAQGKKVIEIDDLTLVFIGSLYCNIKHVTWSYENEFRCTIGSIAGGMQYTPAYPKEIFIGLKCTQTYKERLIKIARQLNIPVYQMSFDEQSENFNLTPIKVNEENV